MSQEIVFKGRCAGWFQLVKHKGDAEGNPIPGTTEVVADWFPNLITNQGLERMGANNNYFGSCQVGSGNDVPAFTDTALETFVAGTSTQPVAATNSTQPGSPYYAATVGTYRFPTGDAAGNLSEIGTGWATTGATLFSRALILDGGGSPTTITILSDEILDVTYQFRVYPPEVDTTGTIMISAVPYDFTARASRVTVFNEGNFGGGWGSGFGGASATIKGQTSTMVAFSGGIGAITAGPSGSTSQTSNVTAPSYVPTSLENDGELTWDISVAAIGSYMSVRVRFQLGEYQVEFDPVIPKTAINELRLTFRNSWSRATIP